MPDAVFYRHEYKYVISYADYLAVKSRLKHVMTADPHTGPDGRYLIRSVYFDNYNDKALREKIDGIGKREKYRIRFYNDDLSFISLEKKMKIGSRCLKYSECLSENEFNDILHGNIDFMRWHSSDLIKEFYVKSRYQGLKPRVLVSYVREPFIYKAGNVRVTFDTDLRTSLFTRNFMDENSRSVSAADTPQDMLMEVKYDAFLPEIIQDLIQIPDVRQQAFSKYGASRRFG